MSRTKIVVLQLKEIIYTAIFAALGILLVVFLVIIFTSGKGKSEDQVSEADTPAKYKAGVYTSVFTLGDNLLNMEVVVDPNHINSIRLVNLDESVTTMYPLIEPSLASIASQLCEEEVDIDAVKLSEDSKYTQMLLLETVKATIEKAKTEE
ncbi:MAG: hypothetical protein J6B85_07745 [Lachnospiraceae bacterium]|nr:hypothetical protein [Lachnospiraceae bacterium]